MIYVKDGIVTWEMQATDYPKLESGLAAVRAARLPTWHRFLLVHLQPAADEVSLCSGRAAGYVAGSAGQARGPSGGLGVDCGQSGGPPTISGGPR